VASVGCAGPLRAGVRSWWQLSAFQRSSLGLPPLRQATGPPAELRACSSSFSQQRFDWQAWEIEQPAHVGRQSPRFTLAGLFNSAVRCSRAFSEGQILLLTPPRHFVGRRSTWRGLPPVLRRFAGGKPPSHGTRPDLFPSGVGGYPAAGAARQQLRGGDTALAGLGPPTWDIFHRPQGTGGGNARWATAPSKHSPPVQRLRRQARVARIPHPAGGSGYGLDGRYGPGAPLGCSLSAILFSWAPGGRPRGYLRESAAHQRYGESEVWLFSFSDMGGFIELPKTGGSSRLAWQAGCNVTI